MTTSAPSASRKNYVAQIFLVLLLLSLLVSWIFALGEPNLGASAIAILVAVGCAVAAATSALMFKASKSLLRVLGGVGIVVTLSGMSVQFMEPEGILTGYLIPLGGGIFLGAIAVIADRYRFHHRSNTAVAE